MSENVAGATDEPKTSEGLQLSQEDLQRHAEVARHLTASLGQIVAVLMRSEAHRLMHLAELEWLVLPAVATSQFSVVAAQSKSIGVVAPLAAVLWASVSSEVDGRLQRELHRSPRLKLDEWKSGDTIWIVEAVGEPRAKATLIKSLLERDWKGKNVKCRVLDEDMKPSVKQISP